MKTKVRPAHRGRGARTFLWVHTLLGARGARMFFLLWIHIFSRTFLLYTNCTLLVLSYTQSGFATMYGVDQHSTVRITGGTKHQASMFSCLLCRCMQRQKDPILVNVYHSVRTYNIHMTSSLEKFLQFFGHRILAKRWLPSDWAQYLHVTDLFKFLPLAIEKLFAKASRVTTVLTMQRWEKYSR